MLFHSWSDLGQTVFVSGAAFLVIVALLRIVGQQALGKMSGFDIVFTVTMGSVVATVAVDRSVRLADAIAALVTMLLLQEIIRRLQSRSLRVHHLVREAPEVVLWDGMLLEDRLRKNSISADEIRAAVRRAGLSSLSDARAVVLENDGDWSVIPKSAQRSDESALLGLSIPGRSDDSGKGEGARARIAPANRLP